MKRCFTHYWTNDTYSRIDPKDQELTYIYGKQFHKRKVKKGDEIYCITVMDGKLYFVGKLVVGKIETDEDGWQVINNLSPSPMQVNLRVPLEVTERLRFQAMRGKRIDLKSPVFDRPGYLNQQTFRSLRELTQKSADLLNELI